MARARKKPAPSKRGYHVGPFQTLNSETTGIPAKEWFQPKSTTEDEDRTELIERVESYARHIEQGLSPLEALPELLGEVADQLRADEQMAPQYEEACDRLARCEVAADLQQVVRITLKENKGKSELTDSYLVDEICGAVVTYINDGIEPTEPEETKP